jgi:hypothetical protein
MGPATPVQEPQSATLSAITGALRQRCLSSSTITTDTAALRPLRLFVGAPGWRWSPQLLEATGRAALDFGLTTATLRTYAAALRLDEACLCHPQNGGRGEGG